MRNYGLLSSVMAVSFNAMTWLGDRNDIQPVENPIKLLPEMKALYHDSVEPFSDTLFPECQREWSKVGNKCCRYKYIAQQVVVDSLEIRGCLCPPLFLST